MHDSFAFFCTYSTLILFVFARSPRVLAINLVGSCQNKAVIGVGAHECTEDQGYDFEDATKIAY